MSQFKEFTSKALDDAIQAACDHFGASREKLEIDIVSGGSSGIFGLMSKKAVVKARLREKREPFADLQTDESLLGDVLPEVAERKAEPKPEPKAAQTPKPKPKAAPAPKTETKPEPAKAPVAEPAPERQAAPAPRPRPEAPRTAPAVDTFDDEDDEAPGRDDSRDPEPDEAALNAFVVEVVERLLDPIVGKTKLVVSNEPGRIKVLVDDEANSGLIIGREGQTITALQYITNRILARRFQTNTRVHLDAGDYRDKQDENLRQLALFLADKAKDQGRTQSTKPLSSYHRRLVHLALQDDETVSTRSKGDGPLKRVLIYPSNNGNRRPNRRRPRA